MLAFFCNSAIALLLPVFNMQTINSAEFASIVGNERLIEQPDTNVGIEQVH